MARTTVVKIEIKNRKVVKNYDIYIGRRWNLYGFTEDSFWHNRFREDTLGKKRDGTKEEVIEGFRLDIVERRDPKRPDMLEHLPELAGKRLGCYCVSEPIDHVREKKECHGEILLQLLAERGLIDV